VPAPQAKRIFSRIIIWAGIHLNHVPVTLKQREQTLYKSYLEIIKPITNKK
jgi:hypothetical protein